MRPMRAAEDDIAGTKQSVADGPSFMRAIIAVLSTTPRRLCREPLQTNLVRIAYRSSLDDPWLWMVVRRMLPRTV